MKLFYYVMLELLFYFLDNNRILGYKYGFYQNASDQCKKEGSFIKWYPNNFCRQEPILYPFWTNGRRYNHTFYLKKSGKSYSIVLLCLAWPIRRVVGTGAY